VTRPEANVAEPFYKFRLYVAGRSDNCSRAHSNLTAICEARLPDRHEIEIVDLASNPARARDDNIVAVPTVVRRYPEPTVKVIGDLSNTARVLEALRIEPA
jgi:circadian clock protein KaiB